VATLGLLTALVYAGTLRFDFVFDDDMVVLGDALVAGPWNLGEILGSQVRVADVTLGYYRPLVTLSYRLDRLLWGTNPAGYHLTNLLWHVLATYLVYALAKRTGASALAAWIGALCFGLLPAHAEVLGWIQGRVDLIAAAFLLSALLALLDSHERPAPAEWRWGGLGGALYFLALMAKEAAAPLPLAWAVWEFTRRDGRPLGTRLAASLPRFAPLAAALVAYGALRHAAVGAGLQFPTSLSPLDIRLLALFAVIAEYGRILLFPDPGLNLHRALEVRWTIPVVLPALAAAAALAGGLCLAWRRARHLVFWVAWLPIMLLPPLCFIGYAFAPESGFMTAERFLYLPSVAWCVLGGRLLERALAAQQSLGLETFGWATLACLAIAYAALNAVRLAPWSDAADLYRAMLLQPGQSAPVRTYIHNNLGGVYLERGDLRAAHAEFQAALRLNPDYAFTLNNMGVLLIRQGRPEAALPWLERAVRLRADYADAYGNLGAAYEALGDFAAARRAYAAGLRLAPTSARLASGLLRVGGTPPRPRGMP
jgi:tetratricopeptide (TPR) repeat protein